MYKILSKLLAGGAAGIAATTTMSLALAVAYRAGMLGEPPPRKLTRRILARLGYRNLDKRTVDIAAVGAHFAFGAATGALYALLPRRLYGPATGAPFGMAVWSASYQGWIPKLGLAPRPMFDRPGRPAVMVLSHLVFGNTLGLVAKLLTRGEMPHAVTSAQASGGLNGHVRN